MGEDRDTEKGTQFINRNMIRSVNFEISSSISEAIFAGENGFFKEKEDGNEENPRAFGTCFLIIIAIFAVAIGGYFTLRKGVFIGDDFYYKVRADKFVHNTVNYVERTKDDTFLLVADGKNRMFPIP